MLTIKQAADLVGYSVRHMTRLCDEGKIKAERFGWMYAVDEESAKSYAADAPRPGPRAAGRKVRAERAMEDGEILDQNAE